MTTVNMDSPQAVNKEWPQKRYEGKWQVITKVLSILVWTYLWNEQRETVTESMRCQSPGFSPGRYINHWDHRNIDNKNKQPKKKVCKDPIIEQLQAQSNHYQQQTTHLSA